MFSDIDLIDMTEVILHQKDIGSTESVHFYRMCQYILWMTDQIEQMTDAKKAARWIGYALDRMEVMGFITNKESLDMIRMDKEGGRE